MQESKVILTWEAIYDITDIADYLETEFGLKRANQFQNDVQKQLNDLKILANALSRTHINYRNYHIFKKQFPPSIIFYIIKQPEKEIHILRILREECNWEKILTEQQKYTYP